MIPKSMVCVTGWKKLEDYSDYGNGYDNYDQEHSEEYDIECYDNAEGLSNVRNKNENSGPSSPQELKSDSRFAGKKN